ncbi:MAG: DUF1453 family protein [Candidatus Micrarchaeota archaeon]|nr:DUF1453 family protein [Candidatus Micrarchaeota archaeon]MDE1847365.1 DUF1453 family protein [Candidatus Micrarchaeota archaeon]MDE1863980.1 DUF1453 family protein [Candidatus Micrarchaeota archaeon]
MGLGYAPVFIVALLVLVLGRRIVAGRKGIRYSRRSIFFRPVLYLALTAALVIIGLSLWELAAITTSVVVGILLGLKLGKRSNIFEKDGNVMYKRSNEILTIWIISFLIRVGIDFYSNPSLEGMLSGPLPKSESIASALAPAAAFSLILFCADLLLGFSAGLLFGEAVVLYRNYILKYGGAKRSASK